MCRRVERGRCPSTAPVDETYPINPAPPIHVSVHCATHPGGQETEWNRALVHRVDARWTCTLARHQAQHWGRIGLTIAVIATQTHATKTHAARSDVRHLDDDW